MPTALEIQIGVVKEDVTDLLQDMIELDGEFLRRPANSIARAAVGNLIAGDHILTGRLLISIHAEKVEHSNWGGLFGGGGSGYDIIAGAYDPIPGWETPSEVYASYGEYGTENMEAWPYMRPALAANMAYIHREAEEALIRAGER